MIKVLRPLYKCWGGSFYYRRWILDNFPPQSDFSRYIEGCIGGGSVYLNLPQNPKRTDFINDANYHTSDLWRVVQQFGAEFIEAVRKIAYTEENFKNAHYDHVWYRDYPYILNHAISTLVKHRFSRAGLGKDFAWSKRLRGGQPGDANGWHTFTHEQLPLISVRLIKTTILNEDVIGLLDRFTLDSDLFFIDPPWVKSTRATKEAYELEQSDTWHEKLLMAANDSSSRILILGRECDLYNDWLGIWNKISLSTTNNAAQTKTKQAKLVTLWKNY